MSTGGRLSSGRLMPCTISKPAERAAGAGGGGGTSAAGKATGRGGTEGAWLEDASGSCGAGGGKGIAGGGADFSSQEKVLGNELPAELPVRLGSA